MKKTDHYLINEIFYSLQGEGYFTGTPSIFIRFSGCNRACDFCDTDHSTHTPMTIEDILSEISHFPATHVVMTGGEPLLQLDDALIEALHSAGKYVAVETNGTLPAPAGVDWVTCSPKTPPYHIDRIDELKIVFQPDTDVENLAQTLPDAKYYFLQPLSCSNTAEVVDYILAHPHWRLSLQTHRLISIP